MGLRAGRTVDSGGRSSEIEVGARLGTVRHVITRHRITLDVFAARRRAGRARRPLVFVPEAKLADEALTSAARKAVTRIGTRPAVPRQTAPFTGSETGP